MPGNEPGKGTFRWDLPAEPDSFEAPEGWRQYAANWSGGSCRAMVFDGSAVLAATHHAGLVRLDLSTSAPAWQSPNLTCGLPIRDVERLFHPVDAVAIAPDRCWIMAGSNRGAYRSKDSGASFENASLLEFPDMVALPPTWLFCAEAHQIDVVSEEITVPA